MPLGRVPRALGVLLPLLAAAKGRNEPPDVWQTLRRHLAHFVCFTNMLRPFYDVLRENALPVGVIHRLVAHCNITDEGPPPALTSDGRFLSRFFVRNCDSWQERPGGARPSVQRSSGVRLGRLQESAEGGVSFPRDEPTLLELDGEQLGRHVPRWLWDRGLYEDWEGASTFVKPVEGHEEELRHFPLFTQGQPARRARFPKWRRQRAEWRHTLGGALEYRPGTLWIEPEIWVQAKEKETTFHYDYDPLNIVFQVFGSRRFHILRPNSGALAWDFWSTPWKRPHDYGTRWAKQVNATEEFVVELRPRDVLVVPNGWPHRVKYTETSLGYAVRSFTQCQALSLWLGQRLCTLSGLVGGERLCFDDERFREKGGHRALESRGG